MEDSSYVNNWALFGDEEINGRQDEQAMQHQTKHHSDGIETQLLSHGRWITHLKNLASHQEYNAKWKVPGRARTVRAQSQAV